MLLYPIEFTAKETLSIIEQEINLHPQANIFDIYKLLYQACSGPSHMHPDPVLIAQGIKTELSDLTPSAGALFQDIGCRHGFLRIDLTVCQYAIINGNLPNKEDFYSELTRIILASRITGHAWIDRWQRFWSHMQPAVVDFYCPTPGDISAVEDLARHSDVPSHSEQYRLHHKPHYRIIHHSQKETILSLLNSGGING